MVFLDPSSNGFPGPQTTCSFGYTTLDALSDSRWQKLVAPPAPCPRPVSCCPLCPLKHAPNPDHASPPSRSRPAAGPCSPPLTATAAKLYLPKGEREPHTAYRKRLDAASPSGFFRDALRTQLAQRGLPPDPPRTPGGVDQQVLQELPAAEQQVGQGRCGDARFGHKVTVAVGQRSADLPEFPADVGRHLGGAFASRWLGWLHGGILQSGQPLRRSRQQRSSTGHAVPVAVDGRP